MSDGGADAHPLDATVSDAAVEAESGSTADATLDSGEAAAQEGGNAIPPAAVFSSTSVDLGLVPCGSQTPVTKALIVTNNGGAPLVVSASIVGSAFGLTPTSLMVPPGGSGTMMVSATVPGSSTAGTPITGSMAVFTNDPSNANRILLVSATPSGATLTGTNLYVFPSSEVGVPSPAVALQLKNGGNAPATFSFGAPTNPEVAIVPLVAAPAGGVTLKPGDVWNATASYTPTSPGTGTATAPITTTGVTCGSTISTLLFNGQGATGTLSGWPSSLDFGPAFCGGQAPAPRTITLTNSSVGTNAHITNIDTSNANGFAINVAAGAEVPSGGSLPITFTPPAVPRPSSLAPVTGTFVFRTDADSSPQTVTATVQPQGAILAFDTSATTNFGSFGTEILLQSASQNFNVINSGNVAANVTLTAAENGGADAGANTSGDGGADAEPGAMGSFSVSVPVFMIPAPQGGSATSVTQESLTFEPVHANASVGTLAMSVDSTTVLCRALPQPLPLSGNATGGGPVVTPTTLTFGATCGGAAPATESFVVANAGTVDLMWTMSAITGPGAGQYSVVTSAPPGLLIPGGSTTVTVTAAKVASPAPIPNPSGLTGQITINTDVPFDPPHVVTLSEVPLGDQLSVSVGSLRFGQVPINTSLGQSFTVTNSANPGSQDANLSLTVASSVDGGSAAAYSVQAAGGIAAGGQGSETITFDATNRGSYPATVAFTTTDALCSALPSPVVLSGTGTGGALSLSATTLTFGTNSQDPNGFVNCGATGLPNTLSLSNVGNQGFNVTAVTLGKGAQSPFALSGPATTLPANLGIAGATSITVTPSAIPAAVANPNDASAFSDTLTITTDAPGDTPHVVQLVMQAYGAVIVTGNPLQTAWTFGTIGAGSIGTFTNTIQNTGNAPATVSLNQLTLPQVFGLENNPTTVPSQGIAALVGQFTPPSANGTWIDQGQLVVAASSAFCQPLPTQWVTPTISLSGSSNANPVVTVSGSPVFATTDCGGAPPAGQAVTLTNSTNVPYSYTVKLGVGTWYTFTDANAGRIAANGVATIVVNPKTVTPGQGVLPGSAPYADELVIDVTTTGSAGVDGGSDAGSDADAGSGSRADAGTAITSFTVPISWTLNGAVLSLPDGSGPSGQGFYVADSTSGFALSIDNAGNASADVDFAIQPSGAFTIVPAPPIQVTPNVRALPQLVSGSASVACPSATTGTMTDGSATFVYSGPVCQPLGRSSVTVHSCTGTYP